jgi:hypothetical protein
MRLVPAALLDLAVKGAAITIQDLAMGLSGSAVGALLVTMLLWPAPGTPRALFGWSTARA